MIFGNFYQISRMRFLHSETSGHRNGRRLHALGWSRRRVFDIDGDVIRFFHLRGSGRWLLHIGRRRRRGWLRLFDCRRSGSGSLRSGRRGRSLVTSGRCRQTWLAVTAALPRGWPEFLFVIKSTPFLLFGQLLTVGQRCESVGLIDDIPGLSGDRQLFLEYLHRFVEFPHFDQHFPDVGQGSQFTVGVALT